MADISATKLFNGKPITRKFNEFKWNSMGKDKNGWVADQDQQIENTVATPEKTVTKPQKVQTISNDLNKDPGADAASTTNSEPNTNETFDDPKYSDETIQEFMKHVKGYNKGVIKDHFDSLKPPVTYDNTIGLPELKKMLGEYYKYDIVSLQKAFA